MHDFRAYIFAKANSPAQCGLSAIAELLVSDRRRCDIIWPISKLQVYTVFCTVVRTLTKFHFTSFHFDTGNFQK